MSDVTITQEQKEAVERFLEMRHKYGVFNVNTSVAATTLAIEWAVNENDPALQDEEVHQAIVTLPDGQQISIWSKAPIELRSAVDPNVAIIDPTMDDTGRFPRDPADGIVCDSLSVQYRRSPGSCWDGEVKVGPPHGRPTHPTIHFGSW